MSILSQLFRTRCLGIMLVICAWMPPLLIAYDAGGGGGKDVRELDGLPFYSFYGLEQLGGGLNSPQLTEDLFGRMVLMDENRLMTFDAHSWAVKHQHSISSPQTVVSTLAFNGKLYAGCIGAWGEMKLADDGDFKFEPFSNSDASWASSSRFSAILPLDGNIFFVGSSGIVRRTSSGLETYWKNIKNIQTAFIHGGTLIISRAEEGLFKLVGDEWVRLPGTEIFFAFDSIFHSEAVDAESAVVATLSGKLYRVNAAAVERWETDADAVMSQGISALQHLGNGYFAVAITGYGIIALDPEGDVVMQLTARQDPAFASINDLFQQEQGILWAALSNGVARIYFPSQLTVLDYRLGLPLLWPQVLQHQTGLYLVTEGKLYQASQGSLGRLNGFERVPLPGMGYIEGACVAGEALILSTNGTLYEWKDGRPAQLIANTKGAQRLIHLRARPEYIICAGTDGHTLLKKVDGCWNAIDASPSSGTPLYGIDSPHGDAWIEQGIGRVSRIWVEDDRLKVDDFEKLPGLEDRWLNISVFSGQLLVSSNRSGLFFDASTGVFTPAPGPEEVLSISPQIFARPSSDGDLVWAPSNKGLFILTKDAQAGWAIDSETARPLTIPYTLPTPMEDGSAWFTSQRTVIRFNPRLPGPNYRPLEPVITHIEAQNTSSGETLSLDSASGDLKLPYSSNSLLLRFFPNSYSLPSMPAYRYRVLGFRNDWSAPFKEPVLNLTNLPEGSYRIELELLDQDMSVGAITGLNVTIRPPWYRNWQGAALFLAIAAAVILLTIKLVQRQAEKERRRLARIVAERTSELDQTNQKLRESVKQVTAAAEAKSRFLANMSHEIRTPMNGVVGTTELLSKSPLSEDQRELVDIVNKSGKLLLSIVNDVLDYSKIEADQIVFENIIFSPADLVEDVLDLLGERANEKGVELFLSVHPSVPNEVLGDTTRLQQILVNLAANAIKFTHHGEVEVAISTSSLGEETVELVFAVRDTGIGIDPEKMDRLFVSFSQLDASNTRIYGGSGLGLVITQRLIERMGGSIHVDSVQGEGSTFVARIPLGVSASSKRPAAPLKSLRILLVDHCSARNEATVNFLSAHGHSVVALHPLDAIQSLQSGSSYDVVIQDADTTRSWEPIADTLERLGPNRPSMILVRFPLDLVSHPAITTTITKPWRYRRLLKELDDLFNTDKLTRIQRNQQKEVSELQSLGHLKVLLAEDNLVNQRVGMLLLKKIGIDPTLAINGAEAVGQLQEKKFDVVLMDVQMPVMDGIQATRTIRELLPQEEQPIIIALSAGAMSSDREAAFAAGVDAYLTKPLRLEMLHAQLLAVGERIAHKATDTEARAS